MLWWACVLKLLQTRLLVVIVFEIQHSKLFDLIQHCAWHRVQLVRPLLATLAQKHN